MQKRMQLAGALAGCALFLFACSKDSGGGGTNPPGGGPGAGTPGPKFTSVRTLVQGSCAVSGCHTGSSPQNGINFSNDATIVAQKDRIKVRAVDDAGTPSQMPPPPRPALSGADRAKITDWLAAGGRLTD